LTEPPISTAGPQSAIPFGSYLLLKRLAVGGMAELFLAKDTRNDRMVVLKRILPYLAEEAEFVRMFLDEARIAASLHHPSIVELFELGHLEGSTFIAMEWVDGIDLRRVLQKEQERHSVVPAGVGAWFVARLCEGLHHAHFAKDASGMSLGIIHRDVSPQNVMVSFKADVKLVDFGIAKATAWMGRSKPGVIKGKFLYLAPEQLTTEPLDHRTDLFALGTMLYELTTGQSPFYRTSTEAVIYAIRMEEPDPPSKVRKDFPPGLEKIILKCLVKDRQQRYQTAEDIRVDLEDFIRYELPTTRSEALRYVSTLFGDDNERTSIFIPPNAQSPARTESRTDTSTQRDKPQASNSDDEETRPISSPRAVSSPPVPEGRRQTGEIGADPAGPTKSDRPRVRSGINPWEPEVTAPMPRPEVARRRDFQATAEIDDERALGRGDVAPTAVSMSGARDVQVGEIFAPLLPTMMGETAAELPPVPAKVTPPRPPPRPYTGRLAPPIPSYDSLPDLSVVSAGEATQGVLMDEAPEHSEPSEPSEPTPPPPSTRAPPRRGPPPSLKRPFPRDPDDDVATVDQANEFSVSTRSSSQKVMLALFGVAGLVVLGLLLMLLWPSSEPDKPQKPVPTKPAPLPKVEPKPLPTPTPPVTPGMVRVQVRAMKGTSMTVEGKPVAPDAIIERLPGELAVRFLCPAKKKVKMTPGTLRAQIPESAGLVAVEVPCR
jgi:eukaryotic-like serine/threonine-protein kinase